MNDLLIAVAALFIIPLLPAYILYKFLPSKTNVSGPFRGLSIKLTGSFGGYFILILIGSTIFFTLYAKQNEYKAAFLLKQAETDSLNRIISQLTEPITNSEEWTIEGKILSTVPEQTRVFFDDDIKGFRSTGHFQLMRRCALQNGKPQLPLALCILNKTDGYKVVDISRNLNPVDLVTYNITFNDTAKTITINNPIDLFSHQRDSIRYIKNFIIKTPEIKAAITRLQPGIFSAN